METKYPETIIIREGSLNGCASYIEVYRENETERFDLVIRGVPSLNDYFRKIEKLGVKNIINETMYCFPENLPFNLKIIDNK